MNHIDDLGIAKEASKAYYEGNPTMSDEEYDGLVQRLSEQGIPEQVASGYTPSTRKVSREIPLLSLSKAHTEDDIANWLSNFPDHSPVMVEPKWDGLAVELRFEDGQLALAATRGNGYVGEDITESARGLIDLPTIENGTVVGEVVMDREKLSHINAAYELDYANTRNATAGIIRRLDELGFELSKNLRFVQHNQEPTQTYLAGNIDEVMEAIHDIGNNRLTSYPCDIDGAVVKIVGQSFRDELGSNNTHPRWAIAYKFAAQSTTTAISHIEWSVGRTGKVVPVAIFDPISLAGATITNATLHNVSIVREFDLHYGDFINVQRSGDVIPYITGVEKRGEGERIPIPTVGDDGSEYVTVGRNLMSLSGGNLLGKLTYAISILGVDGVGPGTISSLIENGLIDPDLNVVGGLKALFSLEESQIEVLDGFGPTSASVVVNALKVREECTIMQWIASLGISMIGNRLSLVLIDHLGSLDKIIEAEEEDLINLPGIGYSRLNTIIEARPILIELRSLLEELDISPAGIEELDETVHHDKYTGKNVVVTGTIEGVTRNDISNWLVSLGAVVQGSVTSKTDILIAGEKAGSKLKKATELGIKVIEGPEVLQDMDEGV